MVNDRIILIEPPFQRLYKYDYLLERYPLSLGYLAGTVKKETDWDVMAYNADFFPGVKAVIPSLHYRTTIGFKNYLNNLALPGFEWVN